jgi:flagellar hook assembly protein FlgD
VASLASGAHAAGVYRPIWDGRDANGQPVRPGLYFVRLITAQGRFAKSVIMLR